MHPRNLLILAMACLIGPPVLAGCDSSSSTDAKAPPPAPVEVKATHPDTGDVDRLIELPADIQPSQEAVLYAKTAGYVDRVLVDKGDSVKMGQLLAVIRAPELQADTAQAASVHASDLDRATSATAASQAATSTASRAAVAVRQSKEELAQAPSNLKRAQAELAQAEDQMAEAKGESEQSAAALAISQAEVTQAESELSSSESQMRLAQSTYDRYQGIYKRDSQLIALQDVEIAGNAAEVAKQNRATALSKLNVAKKHVVQAMASQRIAESKVQQAMAHISVAQASEEVAVSDAKVRQQKLEASNLDWEIARKRVAEVSASAGQMSNLAAASGNALKRSTALSGYANIVAPYDGAITKRFVDAGAFIQTASTSLNAAAIVTVSDLRALRIYLSIPESEASFVNTGTMVKVALATDAKKTIKAKVSRTSRMLDPKTRTLLAQIDLPNPDGKILAGSYALAKVVLETHRSVMRLPSKAVGKEKSGRFVWVIDGGKAKHVSVQTGFDDGTNVEIKSGLAGTEQVVADKLDSVTPGSPVKIQPSK